jgi:homocysteine S-methyltransferase
VARACRKAGIPSVISFTVETDGRLASGQTIRAAIEQTDRETGNAPAYYMLNCAHPTHFADALRKGEAWTARLRGLRANASMRSHAALDAAPDLDIGEPADLGRRYRAAPAVRPLLRAGWLLRHRSPPCRADLARLHAGGGVTARSQK